MLYRLALTVFLLSWCAAPAWAQGNSDACALRVDLSPVGTNSGEARTGSAPADVDFGLYPMSVLGIANTLHRNGEAIDNESDRSALTTGPLACVVDSIRAWERAYPADPWIAKDLLTLEVVYLRAHGSEARELAARTEAWLERDYPLSNYAEPARLALGKFREPAYRSEAVAVVPVERTRTVALAAIPVQFVAAPIALVSAPLPPPVTLVASYPAIRLLPSPWERFAPLESDRR